MNYQSHELELALASGNDTRAWDFLRAIVDRAEPCDPGTLGTAAIAAAKYYRIDVLEWLVHHGASLDYKDGAGETALTAVLNPGDDTRSLPTLQYLLSHGADPNLYAFLGRTACHVAAARRLPSHLALLLAHGGNVHLLTRDTLAPAGRSVLDIAKSQTRWCKDLLSIAYASKTLGQLQVEQNAQMKPGRELAQVREAPSAPTSGHEDAP